MPHNTLLTRLRKADLGTVRHEAATAIAATTVLTIPKEQMIRLLHEQREFSDRFIAYMLVRHIRIEEDVVDQLFNSSVKRPKLGYIEDSDGLKVNDSLVTVISGTNVSQSV